MIKKEWMWMYFNDEWNKDTNDEQYLEDGVDDFIGRPKEKPYNDDDYDN